MSKAEVRKIESEIKLLEGVINGILPISALGSILSLIAGPLGVISFGSAGIVGITVVRQYLKTAKPKLIKKLEKFKKKGELTDNKFNELCAILNKLTVES